MKLRIGFGLAMLAGVIGLLWLDWQVRHYGVPLALLWAAISAVAFIELARMAQAVGVKMLRVSGLLGCVAVSTLPVWSRMVDLSAVAGSWGSAILLLLGLVLAAIFLEQMIVHRVGDALRQVACTALAVLYLGVCGAIVLELRMGFGNQGVPALVLFLAAVKFTDIGAYFTGSFLGRHKLILWLSPGKTWEGLAGGLVVSSLVSILVAWALKMPIGLPQAALFGAVVGAAGQFGDLCESLLKRAADVKDSGALVPEFGGVLDIIDSPLLSAPVAMILLNVLMHI